MADKIKYSKSAGGVVTNSKGEILVVNQIGKLGSSWSFPKGHINEGEETLSAAKREINEESGLEIEKLVLVKSLDVYERANIFDSSEIKTMYMFLFKTTEMDLKPKDADNPEARWVNINEVADLLTHPRDREFFLGVREKYLREVQENGMNELKNTK